MIVVVTVVVVKVDDNCDESNGDGGFDNRGGDGVGSNGGSDDNDDFSGDGNINIRMCVRQ